MATRKTKKPASPNERFRHYVEAGRPVVPSKLPTWNVWNTPAETQVALYESDPLRPRPDPATVVTIGVNDAHSFASIVGTFSNSQFTWSSV